MAGSRSASPMSLAALSVPAGLVGHEAVPALLHDDQAFVPQELQGTQRRVAAHAVDLAQLARARYLLAWLQVAGFDARP